MALIVADSSALILLSKTGLLRDCCAAHRLVAPTSVVAEVASKELIRKFPDARVIADLLKENRIRVKNPGEARIHFPASLHRGEKDALLLARDTAGSVLATDDGKAIKAAKLIGIPYIVTPKIVVEIARSGRISKARAREGIERLGVLGRYSPDIIAHALIQLSEVEQ
jgi:predicted nucleic acid-binding protein